ncbi:MAG: CDP-glycerol glycerophosphotransferase family protein, partial [Lachnospiraceae bacterium]|nr:CDP-glycerol glycerophosphotransferase family protein [Lachnospiraceae bacterium]
VDVPDYDNEIKERIVKEFAKYDVCISCSDALDYEYRHAFGYKGEVLHTGYPRNDIFFRADTHIKNKIYELFGLDKNKGIILYAPTFRNIREKSVSRYDLDLDKIIQAAENRFGMKYQVVYRFHYNLSDVYSDSQLFSRGVNATSYPDMQELLLAADILLTDYSSSMWDFSLQRKPVFLYHSDLDLYMSDRGFYSRPDEWPYPSGRSTEELCREITTFDSELYRMKVDEFFEKYGSYDDGHATERVVDRVLDVMRLPDKYGKA